MAHTFTKHGQVLTIVSRHGAWSGGSALGVVLQIAGVICKASAATLAQYYNWRPETVLSLALDFRGLTPSFLDPRHLSKGGGTPACTQSIGDSTNLCLRHAGMPARMSMLTPFSLHWQKTLEIFTE
ncbi:hypothetical protein AK812_SmicGene28004 [Symbiodinium microadriaticum]|uniref:Uncharacterized protein n=1 Tax=Symbiodinium microadriaticum TaxID=2951 RepID=A0A1Q9D5H2_SYMMI|nr:hypothetical protein AK812_SmicGene28004 [Symbiodinium microadriaticum]